MRRLWLALLVAAIAAAALTSSGPASADNPVAAPRFVHETHATRGVKIDDCQACHALGADGRAAPPTTGKQHQPCAASGCHEAQFFAAKPTLCVVCHDGSDPTQKLVARYNDRQGSEFGGQINHASHSGAKVTGQGPNGACVACHGDLFRKGAAPAGGDSAPGHGSPRRDRKGHARASGS